MTDLCSTADTPIAANARGMERRTLCHAAAEVHFICNIYTYTSPTELFGNSGEKRLFLAFGERCGANVQGPLLLSWRPILAPLPCERFACGECCKANPEPAIEKAAVSGGGHSIRRDPSLRQARRSTGAFQKTPGPPK